MGKHSAAPASRGAPDQPRDTSARDAATAGGEHSTAEFPRADFVLPADEPIELLAEPLAEPLHEPLAAPPVAGGAAGATTGPDPGSAAGSPAAASPTPVPAAEQAATQPTPHTRRAPGARRAPAPPPAPRRPGRGRQVASYGVAALLTALAWAVLVYLAIQLGPDVRDGEPRAWALMVVATIGAMACLFLSLLLAGRVLETLRPAPAAGPPPPPGGRRAKR